MQNYCPDFLIAYFVWLTTHDLNLLSFLTFLASFVAIGWTKLYAEMYILGEVHWPLTFDPGQIWPKIYSVHLLNMGYPWGKYDVNPPKGFLDIAVTSSLCGEKCYFFGLFLWPLTLTFDLWPLFIRGNITLLICNLPSKFHPYWAFLSHVICKNVYFRSSSLTFDLWPWADFAQNLISSSTHHKVPLG